MKSLINAVGFQAGWWACIIGVGHGLEIPALLFGLSLVIAHLFFCAQPLNEARLALAAVVVGVVVDSSLQWAGVITFWGWSLGACSPFWLWLLWGLFALTLPHSLSFLKNLPHWLHALLGAVLGPLTYYAGAQLGAAQWAGRPVDGLALAVAWALALPLLVQLARQMTWNGSKPS